MPTDPATTSQVQAYRFVLRRMESALVRKDAVMLHEPMRHHLRATAVGVVLGVVGLIAAFVLGGFGPAGDLSANDIVRVDPSEAVYVAVDVGALKLIPVPNLTTARLLVAAIAPGREAPVPKRMPESALARYGRLAASDYPGTPAQLPAPANLIKGVWSVCDGPVGARARPATTVLIQERPPAARALADDQAVLVAEPASGATYLVRREVRSRIDLRDPATRNYYRLDGVAPRELSAGLLNAIPERGSLDFEGVPARAPRVLRNTDTSAACLTWQDPTHPPVVSLHPDGLPLAQGESPVALTRAASGVSADSVFLTPSKGVLVRDETPGQGPGSGTIWLVTDQGVRYTVPSTQVARALGLGELTAPAPPTRILSLLPIGVPLDPQKALRRISPELAASRAGS